MPWTNEEPTTFKVWDNDAGVWKVTGNPEALKRTQSYPVGFGRAMAKVFGRFGKNLKGDQEINDAEPTRCEYLTLDDLLNSDGIDTWQDAEMPAVLEYLKGVRCNACCCGR